MSVFDIILLEGNRKIPNGKVYKIFGEYVSFSFLETLNFIKFVKDLNNFSKK